MSETKNTVKVQQPDGSDLEIYETQIYYYADLYAENWQIDLHQLSQSRWNSCLHFIYENVFEGTDLLKSPPFVDYSEESYPKRNFKHGNLNSYYLPAVESVLDVYISMCEEYEKQISLYGFCTLTQINRVTIYEWHNKRKEDPSFGSYDIYEKIMECEEESLSNKLLASKSSPVGVLGILNHNFGWSTAAGTAGELKQTAQSIEQIQQKYLSENVEQEQAETETTMPGDSQEEIQELSFD